MSELAHLSEAETLALRAPDDVMRLSRMGSFFPTRLSFLRSMLRELAAGDADHAREMHWDADGFGHATFAVTLSGKRFTLIAWTCPLDDDARSDRVIATAWDACFVLYDGVPSAADIERLGRSAKVQEGGRYDPRVLVVSRANKSVRLFAAVADALSRGEQPDAAQLAATGYLMRTTAVYGNGKFGMADREVQAAPFRLEMLAVYLIREFTFALVEHVGGGAKLSEASRKLLGIGNSTGLGMAPFLVSHPVLLNNWMVARETALARVRALDDAGQGDAFCKLCERATAHLAGWNVDDPQAQGEIEDLREAFGGFCETVSEDLEQPQPWDALMRRAEQGSEALQELVLALVLEPHGELIDDLTRGMGATDDGRLEPRAHVSELRAVLAAHYDWALALDLDEASEDAVVWYVSEDKLEPRLGAANPKIDERKAMPHDIARRVQALEADLREASGSVAEFLMRHPRHRAIVKRVQTVSRHPFGEVRDNLVSDRMRPIDLLRCKLSFFGASRFDPRSDRWTRITLFAGAPSLAELTAQNADDCFLPHG